MESPSQITLIDLNSIYDFSSISFALMKQLEEDPTKNYKDCFKGVKLSSFHLTSFQDFSIKYSNGDAKTQETLYTYIKQSNLYTSVKPRLYFLNQLHFLITNNLINPQSLYIYYEEPSFINFLSIDDYIQKFKSLINITHILPLNDVLNILNQTPPQNPLLIIGDSTFISDKLSQYKSIIVDNTKTKKDDVIDSYYNSISNYINSKYSSYKEKYDDYMRSEMIMKYNSQYLNKKFAFFSIWKNYTLYKQSVVFEGKVVKGFQRGSKQLGIPTANIEMNSDNEKKVASLINGVYFGFMTFKSNSKNIKCIIEKENKFKCVVSIGYNPSFDNNEKTIEVFLIHYNDEQDFYDEEVSLEIKGYSRSEECMMNLPELVTTITYDIILFNEILDTITN